MEGEREGEREDHTHLISMCQSRALQIEVLLSVIYSAPIRGLTARP